MAEGEQRRGVDDGHLAALAQSSREVRRGLGRAGAGEAQREPTGRVDPTAQDIGHGAPALLSREEAADQPGQPAGLLAQVVGAADEEDDHDGRPGVEQRLQQLLLAAREPEVDGITALPRRAVAEQAGLVAQHGDAHLCAGREGRGVGDVAVVATEHRAALRVGDLEGVGQGLPHRGDLDPELEPGVVQQDVTGEGVAAHHRLRRVRARPDHGDPGAVEQRQRAVVREEHHGASCQLESDRPRLRRIEVDRRRLGRHPVRVEQAELALLGEDTVQRPVHQRLVDQAVRECGEQRLAVGVDRGQLDVDARREGEGRCLARTRGDVVQRLEEGDREVVGGDGAGEPETVAQQVGEHRGVGRGRHSVEVVVGVHHRPDAGPDRHLERRHHHVHQLARSHRHRCEVARGPRRGVAREVLDGRNHARALDATDVGAADEAHEERILAHRLLDPAPAQVSHHVEDRGHALVDAEQAHGLPDLRTHPLDETGVEGGRPAQGRGEDRGPPRGQAGEDLLVHLGRDAEPVRGHHRTLALGQGAHPLPRLDGRRAERPGELAEAVLDDLVPPLAPHGVPEHRGHLPHVGVDAPETGELGDLLRQGHPRHQVADACLDRDAGVLPRVGARRLHGVRHEASVRAAGAAVDRRTTSLVSTVTWDSSRTSLRINVVNISIAS